MRSPQEISANSMPRTRRLVRPSCLAMRSTPGRAAICCQGSARLGAGRRQGSRRGGRGRGKGGGGRAPGGAGGGGGGWGGVVGVAVRGGRGPGGGWGGERGKVLEGGVYATLDPRLEP